MVEEKFTDAERHRLIDLVLAAMNSKDPTLLDILNKLAGTDTLLIARRAYRSRALIPDRTIQQCVSACYNDPNFPERVCKSCRRRYTGPSSYCSLECAKLAVAT